MQDAHHLKKISLVYDLDLEEVQLTRLKDAKFKNQRLELLKSEITEPKIIKIPW